MFSADRSGAERRRARNGQFCECGGRVNLELRREEVFRMEKKKVNRKRIWKILSLVVALVITVLTLQETLLCNPDANRGRIKGFYLEDKDSIDVVLIGASDVYAAFSSCFAYEKYGFTSYPLATTGNIIQNYKTQIKTAVKRQHPKLIVVEVNGALYPNDADYEEEARLRRFVDNIPLDADKAEMIEQYVTENKWEYYLPFLKYHSIWKDFPMHVPWNLTILQNRFRGYSYLKGAKCKTRVRKKPRKVYSDKLQNRNKRGKLNPTAERELRSLLKYCREEKMDNIVFVRFPHMVVKKTLPNYYRSNTVGDIIEEYGYDYLNFDRDFKDTGLNLKRDFYNVEHLNIYGQKKFTEYFGGILRENYGITESDLTPSQKEEWDNSAAHYEEFCSDSISYIKGKKPLNMSENHFVIKKIEKMFPFAEELIEKSQLDANKKNKKNAVR